MYGNLVGPNMGMQAIPAPTAFTPLNFQPTTVPTSLDYQRAALHGGVMTSTKENPNLQMYLYNPFSNHKKAAAVNVPNADS